MCGYIIVLNRITVSDLKSAVIKFRLQGNIRTINALLFKNHQPTSYTHDKYCALLEVSKVLMDPAVLL
jgi:hypothetical protein